MNIAIALTREREARKLSKTQLALLIGVSKSRITDWESGRMPRQASLNKIVTALSVTVEQLLGFGEKRRAA